MQKYTPLKGGANEKIAPIDPPVSTIPNGYKMDTSLDSNFNTETETTDKATTMASPATVAAATKHYTNKTNMAKLHWWNAPTPRITLDSSLNPTECEEALNAPTQEGREDNLLPKASPNQQINQMHNEQQFQHHHHHDQDQHQQHHHHHHHGYGDSEGANSPLSKSASSSRHKLHHLTATSNDRISNKISLTNQFSFEEDQDQTRQDSQLLLNGKLTYYILISYFAFTHACNNY